jgi:endonuclease/exonuclease/phosphatase family metal-dependent hydrolase
VAGDFNDNACWNRPGRAGFDTVIAQLAALGYRSAYHRARDVPFGGEAEPTLFWRDRRADGPGYHVDYCFLSDGLIDVRVEVGSPGEWLALSDHVPLVVEFSTPQSGRR